MLSTSSDGEGAQDYFTRCKGQAVTGALDEFRRLHGLNSPQPTEFGRYAGANRPLQTRGAH